MTMRRALLAPILLIAAAAPARDRPAIPEATLAGAPRTCLPIQTIEESVVRSDRVIDFRTTGRALYRVTLPQGCPGLGSERRFGYATSIGQLCAQEIITVLYASGPAHGASCGLAPFQPVTLAR